MPLQRDKRLSKSNARRRRIHPFYVYCIAVVALAFRVQVAAREIAVDDTDQDRIAFVPRGAWDSLGGVPLTADRWAGTTTWTATKGATATLKFTGTSITFLSYCDAIALKDKDYLTFDINLDGTHYQGNTYAGPGERQAQCNLFFQGGLDGNVEHTIVITRTQNRTHDQGLNVDAFIYTVDDPPTGSESPPADTTTPTDVPTGTQTSQPTTTPPTQSNQGTPASGDLTSLRSQVATGVSATFDTAPAQSTATSAQAPIPVGAIAGGVIGAIIAGGLVGLLAWRCRKRPTHYPTTTPSVPSDNVLSYPTTVLPRPQYLPPTYAPQILATSPQILTASPQSKSSLPSTLPSTAASDSYDLHRATPEALLYQHHTPPSFPNPRSPPISRKICNPPVRPPAVLRAADEPIRKPRLV